MLKQLLSSLKGIVGFCNCIYNREHNLSPKIIIERLMLEEEDDKCEDIQFYCFSGIPKLILRIEAGENQYTTLYDEKLNIIEDCLFRDDIAVNRNCDKLIKQLFVLSQKLSKDFCFVRVDWMIYKNKAYFEELTFTPYSGFYEYKKIFNEKLGSLINIKGAKNEL